MRVTVPGGCVLLGSACLACASLDGRGKGCDAFETMGHGEVVETLNRGGFSGIIDSAASIRFQGCAGTQGGGVGVYFYQREFGNQRLAQRLILLSNDRYLGMYDVPGPPATVEPGRIVFNLPDEEGNVIPVREGALPPTVLLDGEMKELSR